MATLDELVRDEKLEKLTSDIAISLPPGVLPHRELYATPNIKEVYERVICKQDETWDPACILTPRDQFDMAIEHYVIGAAFIEPNIIRELKPWRQLSQGVWYLKTFDLRLFGWFVEMDRFVLAQAGIATTLKTSNLYSPIVQDVVKTRDKLNLDEPKFVPGNREENVISFK